MDRLLRAGVETSLYHVGKLLGACGLSRRKMAKRGTYKHVEGRNEQFGHIEKLVRRYTGEGHAVVSMDAKKKELLGQLYRPGKVYCDTAQICNDHDFRSQSTGKAVPFGIYDCNLNEGYMFLGQSADTPEFAADCLHGYLRHYGAKRYPGRKEMLVLCDSGGSNGYRGHRFKELLQWVADCTGLKIRVAHYPSYCSKYNPCDHRLFPHVTRALPGVMLDRIETMRDMIKSRAKTKGGLKVFVRQIKRGYQTGIKATSWVHEQLFDYSR